MAKNTGYKIITYIDVNPQSSTYQQTRTERVYDTTTCGLQDENWQLINTYCELNEQGVNTGYKISLYQDMNTLSPTYGTTRKDRVQDTTTCPLASTDPNWIEDDKFAAYCETKFYEPSHTEGLTGNKICRVYDANPLSPTYMSGVVSSVTSSDCPAPDTTPQLEVVTESCQICSYQGQLQYSGLKDVTAIDKNVYSSTFMQTVETSVEDTTKCPASYTYVLSLGSTSYTATNASGSKSVSVTSTKSNNCLGSVNISYSVSESCHWVSVTTASTGFTLSYTENTATSDRSCTVSVSNAGASASFVLTQNGRPIEYVFTIGSSSGSYAATGESKTISVTSTADGVVTGFTASEGCNWVSVSTASTSFTVTVDAATSYTNSRTCTITLTQRGSNRTLNYTVSQPKKDSTYVFTLDEQSDIIAAEAGSYTYAITSTKNGSNQGYSVSESCDWLSVSTGATSYSITVTNNTSTATSRSCFLTFTQNESENVKTMSITQSASAAPDVYIFTIASDHDEFDASAQTRAYAVTSTKNGSSIGFTASESLSWLTATTSSTGVSVSVDENNGTQRSGTIQLTQSESGYFVNLYIQQNAKPASCTVTSITASPTQVSLNPSGQTLITVGSTGTICTNDWEAYKLFYNINTGQWMIMPQTETTGHSGTYFTISSAGRYRIYAADDSAYSVGVTAKTAYSLCVSGNTNTPNAWEIAGTASSTEQVCNNNSPIEFGITCTATTSDQGHLSRTLYYSFTNASVSSIGAWKLTDGMTSCSGDSASLNTTIQCGTDCYVTFGTSQATLENNTMNRWMVDAIINLSTGDQVDFRGTLYGAPMMGLSMSAPTDEEEQGETDE